jgi:hypothetical protein
MSVMASDDELVALLAEKKRLELKREGVRLFVVWCLLMMMMMMTTTTR